jgi:hypothetical protein
MLRFIQLGKPLPPLKLMAQSQRVKEKLALPVLSLASFAVTVYMLRALILVGVPLMVQVALSILKPAATIGSAITNITFNNSGGAIASCTAAPTLPAGLSINSTTCTISGTPTEVRAQSHPLNC